MNIASPTADPGTLSDPLTELDPDRDFSWSIYQFVGRSLRSFTRWWFRYRIDGLEKVPNTPVLLIGNHSGVGVADVLCLVGGWYDHFGVRRRATGLMHDLFVDAPLLGRLCRGFGAVKANPRNARHAAKRGHDIVIFPGGDIDACRPFNRPREVDFGARRGYIRLALETGRPIVPIATLGSHPSYLLLPLDGLWRAIRLRSWSRLERFPVAFAALPFAALVVAVLAGAVSPLWILPALLGLLIPNPVRVTSKVLAPIDVCAATAHITDAAARVEAAHALVHGALAAELLTMEHPRD